MGHEAKKASDRQRGGEGGRQGECALFSSPGMARRTDAGDTRGNQHSGEMVRKDVLPHFLDEMSTPTQMSPILCP